MDRSLLLLSLARAVAPVRGEGTHLALVAGVERITAGLAGLMPQPAFSALRTLLRASAAGGLPTGALLAELGPLAAALREVADEPALVALAAQAQTIVALRCGANGGPGALRHATINLAATSLADLVDEWRLAATPGSPETIVARVPAEADGPLTVRLSGKGFVERRVAVSYAADTPFPRLLLAAPSRGARDEAPQDRDSWHQLPFPDYDLAVLSEQERHKGSVATRRLEGRVIAHGATLTLALDAPEGHGIISTEILDETDRPLARVICWPSVAT